jgi:predicted RNase H-like HicB family nuclease
MSNVRSYTLEIEHHPEDNGYLARFPALPGCQTWGETYEEAIKHAEDALALYIDVMIEDNEPLPVDSGGPGPVALSVTIRVPEAA